MAMDFTSRSPLSHTCSASDFHRCARAKSGASNFSRRSGDRLRWIGYRAACVKPTISISSLGFCASGRSDNVIRIAAASSCEHPLLAMASGKLEGRSGLLWLATGLHQSNTHPRHAIATRLRRLCPLAFLFFQLVNDTVLVAVLRLTRGNLDE